MSLLVAGSFSRLPAGIADFQSYYEATAFEAVEGEAPSLRVNRLDDVQVDVLLSHKAEAAAKHRL